MYRLAVARDHGHVANIIHTVQLAQRAHQQHLVVAVDAVAAGVAVVTLDRLRDIVEGHTVLDQCIRFHNNFVVAHLTAERVHVGNARYLAQMRTHDPVLQAAQLLVAVTFALDAVHEDLAERRRDRREPAFNAGRH